MSASQVAALERESTAVKVRRGERIVRRGALLLSVYAVGVGTIKLSLYGAGGEERVLRVVHAGDSFGEPIALARKACLYDAFALSEAHLLAIPASAIFALVRHDPRFAQRLVATLAERSSRYSTSSPPPPRSGARSGSPAISRRSPAPANGSSSP